MTLPPPNPSPQAQPTQPSPEPAAAAPGSPVLGRWALGLGVAALVCGVVSAIGAVLSLFRILAFDFSPATSLGTLVGLTAIGLGIAAAVSRRGRRAGIMGIVMALAGALVWGLVWGVLMLYTLIGFGAVIVDQSS